MLLHEFAHVHLKHWHVGLPEAQIEYEAEHWAIATMRREGIAVPRVMIRKARQYVRWCIKREKEKGRRKIAPHVEEWANGK